MLTIRQALLNLYVWIWSKPFFRKLFQDLAWIWRRINFRTKVVAITGSMGKTTAKELLAELLASRYRVVKTPYNRNDHYGVPRTIFKIRPWHQFAVVEVGVSRPGQMQRLAQILRPDMVVLTCMAKTHALNFRNLDEHAAEKAVLVHSLKPENWCIANGDDERIFKIARECGKQHMLFGTDSGFDLWAENIRSNWPDRLGFNVHHGNRSFAVHSQMIGTHWLPAALGSLAASIICGLALEDACKEVIHHEPVPGRLRPMHLPSGVTIIRDDYSSSLYGLKAALKVLAEASAQRRILVFTDFSDFKGNRKKRLRYFKDLVGTSFDFCLLIGEMASYGRRRLLENGFSEESVSAVDDLQEAHRFLEKYLLKGDLVLLKGRTTDHISRLYFALLGPIGCWKKDCTKTILCDICPELKPDPEDLKKAFLVKPTVESSAPD